MLELILCVFELILWVYRGPPGVGGAAAGGGGSAAARRGRGGGAGTGGELLYYQGRGLKPHCERWLGSTHAETFLCCAHVYV